LNLKVLGTGSSGNCYVLEDNNEILILDVGIKEIDILSSIDFKIQNIAGVLLTHEHKDHSKSIKKLLKRGVHVYTSFGTKKALEIDNYYNCKVIVNKQAFKVGNFKVLPFKVNHDCAEPLGFLINHKNMGNLLFATDLASLPIKFTKLNHILIECNYQYKYLDQFPELKKRVSESHMGLYDTLEFLKLNKLDDVYNLILIHLSKNNSNKKEIIEEIKKEIAIVPLIAEKNLEIFLEKPI
jgi:phosphoribosyl 1,2-cyclic phosphodiesterase